MATGIKRVMPDRVVFTYQGDGDRHRAGEIVHARRAARIHHDSSTTRSGMAWANGADQPAWPAHPRRPAGATKWRASVKMAELIADGGAAYVARRSLHSVKINRAKKAIRAAFEVQLNGSVLRWSNCCRRARPTAHDPPEAPMISAP